jgi:hypothetical protein
MLASAPLLHQDRHMRLAASLVILVLCIGHAYATTPACQTLAGQIDTKTAPLFLPSYPTQTSGPLGGVAFLYDNAAAAIALTGCGDTAKARRIGDAMLWALAHDRYWHDGRLRNAYLAGPVTAAPLKLPGWWDAKENKWVEDQYQVGSDSGNLAWAMLALLALARATHDPHYLSGAERIGTYVARSFDSHAPAGFTGGVLGDEPLPMPYKWKSTEHNTDLAAAFAQLAALTHDDRWQAQSEKAARFVAGMWRTDCSCFDAGSGEDGASRNPFRALDAQLWPLLAIPGAAQRYAGALASARRDMGVRGGFAYSQSKDAVWTEGTAQAALLLELSKQDAGAPLAAIDHNRAADGSYFAIDTAQSQTGFLLDTDRSKPRAYFHLPHLAALAWAAIAQTRLNPFTSSKALPNP